MIKVIGSFTVWVFVVHSIYMLYKFNNFMAYGVVSPERFIGYLAHGLFALFIVLIFIGSTISAFIRYYRYVVHRGDN